MPPKFRGSPKKHTLRICKLPGCGKPLPKEFQDNEDVLFCSDGCWDNYEVPICPTIMTVPVRICKRPGCDKNIPPELETNQNVFFCSDYCWDNYKEPVCQPIMTVRKPICEYIECKNRMCKKRHPVYCQNPRCDKEINMPDICWYYQKGICDYENDCNYPHPTFCDESIETCIPCSNCDDKNCEGPFECNLQSIYNEDDTSNAIQDLVQLFMSEFYTEFKHVFYRGELDHQELTYQAYNFIVKHYIIIVKNFRAMDKLDVFKEMIYTIFSQIVSPPEEYIIYDENSKLIKINNCDFHSFCISHIYSSVNQIHALVIAKFPVHILFEIFNRTDPKKNFCFLDIFDNADWSVRNNTVFDTGFNQDLAPALNWDGASASASTSASDNVVIDEW